MPQKRQSHQLTLIQLQHFTNKHLLKLGRPTLKNRIKSILAFAAIAATLSACSGATPADGGGDGKTITFASVPGWDDTVAVTGLWSVLLEEQGYKVETQNIDVAPGFAGVARGDIDGLLNSWLPSTHGTYADKYKDDIQILDEPYFANDELVLAVPESVEENTISELVQNAEKYESKIIGIEAGSGLMKLLPDVVSKYSAQEKLSIVEGSTPAALAALKNGIDDNKPVVVTLWKPHWAFASMPIKALKDDAQGWPKPDGSYVVLNKKFAEDHADVQGWMSNFKLTEEQYASLMLTVKEATNPAEGSRKWLETPENRKAADEWFKSA